MASAVSRVNLGIQVFVLAKTKVEPAFLRRSYSDQNLDYSCFNDLKKKYIVYNDSILFCHLGFFGHLVWAPKLAYLHLKLSGYGPDGIYKLGNCNI